ncbi:MAG: FecR family protein [Treponema sp.]
MKRYVGIVLACVFCTLSAVAMTATITEIAGKVEYKLSDKDEWQPAKAGTVLSVGSMISTGFKSTAIITMETATLTVKPVTRLSIEELIKAEGAAKSQMFLMTGRVRAEVTPKEGETTDFKVKSPTATASVRGTGFEFDGQNLTVEHGAVQFESGIGAAYLVSSGEFSTLDESGRTLSPIPASALGTLDSAADDIENILYNEQIDLKPELNSIFLQQGTHWINPDPTITISIGWN